LSRKKRKNQRKKITKMGATKHRGMDKKKQGGKVEKLRKKVTIIPE